MEEVRSELVQIVRDFLVAHQTLRSVFARFRAGSLSFDEVRELVGDSEQSVLFRIKERCHSLFRETGVNPGAGVRREALFDLAVGSLFHEAMKFRENLYQRQIYAPRVIALRNEADEDASELFSEFEKILDGAESRLTEALQETEALLDQTRRQFRVLLLGYRHNGLISRCLIEQRELVDQVFSEGLDSLLAYIHGSAAEGYAVAARSYIKSASFTRALEVIDEARSLQDDHGDLERLAKYAEGMQAFSDGQYERSIDLLNEWVDEEPGESERAYASLSLTAVSRIGTLVEGPDLQRMSQLADALARRIAPLARA